MPIMRVKTRRPASRGDPAPSPVLNAYEAELPMIDYDDSFRTLVKKMSIYFVDVISLPSTFEQLRTTAAGDCLRDLTEHLSSNVANPAIINALLALRWHYGASNDSRGLGEARANACEIVAWRFLTRLSEREAVEYCLYEIPDPKLTPELSQASTLANAGETNERTALLSSSSNGTERSHVLPRRTGSTKRSQLFKSITNLTKSFREDPDEREDEEDDPTAPFVNLNALEIAAIADAKRFLSQHVVQKIITGIWNGDIIFWDSLSAHATKRPRFYNPATCDPFSRLRVPKYLKAFEVMFFAAFMALYYAVLIEPNRYAVTPLEILLYLWFVSFAYGEITEYIDAGSIFYIADVWNLFDIVMIVIGLIFAIMRFVGLYLQDYTIVDLAFDVLSLEALFMVPRVCSVLSLSPYWGTLIPCFKEMGKDFLKFMVIVVIVYIGFLTTFSLIGRETFSFPHMTLIVTKIFFGSGPIGFDIMDDIDPVFGPPLMIIFVTLSSILLMGSLTGMLSNSFSRVITHAREEYLCVYSVYVLEASTSNRLTHFYPPFNLISLAIFRPLRVFLTTGPQVRQARIVLLKVTHVPAVLAIHAYEWITGQGKLSRNFDHQPERGPRSPRAPHGGGPSTPTHTSKRPALQRNRPSSANVIHVPLPTRREEDIKDDQSMETPPSDMEVRIQELSAKIDRLTALVESLQPAAGLETIRT